METCQIIHKLDQLRAIASAAQNYESREIEPRTLAAFVVAALVILVSWTVFELSTNSGLVATGATFCFIYMSYPFPRSWKEILDCRVTDYDPVDIHAYSAMHEAFKRVNGFDFHDLNCWLGKESAALRRIAQITDGT